MGKLNILQHKSWHVYNEVNRAKVRQDEENARKEDEKKKEPALQADREARLTLLRKRAQSRRQEAGDLASAVDTPPLEAGIRRAQLLDADAPHSGHINLFADAAEAAAGGTQGGKNKDYEDEKKAKEKAEADRYTWYLGETRDGKKDTPWYAAPDPISAARSLPPEGPLGIKIGEKKRAQKDERRKVRDDPLTAVLKGTGKIGKASSKETGSHKRGTRFGKGARALPTSQPSSTIEKLRAERLRREAEERLKTEQLLNPSAAPIRHEKETSFYNSQFNPHATRSRLERRERNH
ncbi:hypothetical protein DFJ77DRAFT_358998 [Powellomyces hirtus]|nr:hypothetical protein DFJ77DRAFT_358998 [Powellomyces hirtus]